MPRFRPLVAGILAVALSAALPATASAGVKEEMVGALNAVRVAHGAPALRHSSSLHGSSYRYAVRLMRTQSFSHSRRIHASSRFRTLAEMLEMHGGRTPQVQRTVQAWLNSPAHRQILLSPRFRYVGVGVASGRFQGRRRAIWVAHLGG